MSTDRSSFSIHMASVRSVSDAGVAVQIPALTGSGTVVMTRPLLPPSPGDYVMVAVSHDKTKFHWVNDDGSVGLAEAIFDAIAAADERSDGIAEDVYGYLWDKAHDVNDKVDRAGDTMTGNLVMSGSAGITIGGRTAASVQIGSYTPTLTAINPGVAGGALAEWTYVGGAASGESGLLYIEGYILLSGTGISVTTGTAHRISMPTEFLVDQITGSDDIVGHADYRIGSLVCHGVIRTETNALLRPLIDVVAGTRVAYEAIGASAPAAWTTGGTINWNATLRVIRT